MIEKLIEKAFINGDKLTENKIAILNYNTSAVLVLIKVNLRKLSNKETAKAIGLLICFFTQSLGLKLYFEAQLILSPTSFAF